jgi:cyclophilin family peptidyl-prolyl cis-trans isomerase
MSCCSHFFAIGACLVALVRAACGVSVWREKSLKDDPVVESNKRGTISFATSGPNSRTTQMFINFADNSNLDGMGFSPFGKVVEGMETVDRIFKIGEKPNQARHSTRETSLCCCRGR